jgi:hypothetical protein
MGCLEPLDEDVVNAEAQRRREEKGRKVLEKKF